MGSRRIPTLLLALPVGCVIAALCSAGAVALDLVGPQPFLGWVVFTLCLSAPAIALVFAICVDRSTLAGAPDRPEESVESRWATTAASGAFADVVIAAGIGIVATLVLRTQIDNSLLLAAVLLVAGVSVGVRYLIARLGA